MWLLVFEDTENGDNGQSIWDSQEAARQQAVSELLDDIRDRWDLSDPDVEKTARNINDLASVGDYQAAIDSFNNENACGGGHFWSIIRREVHTLHDAAPVTLIPFIDDDDEEEADEDEEEDDPSCRQGVPYQATKPGATCRGPCGNYNPDAYADKSDGTHVCHQCKTFSSIFGS